jgi:lysophospholipase L1-like esterase
MHSPFIPKDLSLWPRSILPVLAAAALVTACVDAPNPVAPRNSSAIVNQAEGRGFAQRLYAIGTSISAGTCSDGNVASCQQNSWVAQLLRAMHREPTLPLVAAPGCKAPYASPLLSFLRTSGESVALPDASLQCAPNVAGVILPTQVLAVPGALTHEALLQTPATRTDPYGAQLYRRILPLEESQVSALEKLNPKFVTVELGANDILGVHGGRVTPGVTFVPFPVWADFYNQVLDRVGAVTKQALLVGLGRDISKLNSLRYGSELWADRVAFLTVFNVSVSPDCDGNTNLIVVAALVRSAVANGLGRLQAGLGPFTLSCTEGAADVEDRILTPAEVGAVNAQFEQMTNHIQAQATARGYAYMDLEVLFSIPKGTFSVVALMTSSMPYGPNISLDGLHPSAAGQTLIAQAAMEAIDDRYNVGFDALSSISRRP